MHADRRQVQRPGQGAGSGRTDEQGPDQPSPAVGHAAEIGDSQARPVEGLAHQRQQLAHMVAAGQFRHHAAVVRDAG